MAEEDDDQSESSGRKDLTAIEYGIITVVVIVGLISFFNWLFG